MRIANHFALIIVATVLLVGCPTIAPYDQRSYELATSTKAQALAVLDKAGERYDARIQEVEALKLDVEKAYEYAGGIPHNTVVVSMWNELRGYVYQADKDQWVSSDNGNLYATLDLWKRNKTLNMNAVAEKKKQVAASFDQIIELEGAKIKR